MPAPQHHMIRQQYLHVEVCGTESEGFAVQRRLSELCQHGFAPALERLFDHVVAAHEHVIIDRLEIEVETLSLEYLERNLTAAVTQALEKQLREQIPPAGATPLSNAVQRRTESQSVHEAFLYFLNTGKIGRAHV